MLRWHRDLMKRRHARTSATRNRAAALTAAVAVSTPGQALAHGITGSAAGKNAWEFIPLGIEHMLLGWDHLLFIAGIVLLAGELKRAAKLISGVRGGAQHDVVPHRLARRPGDNAATDAQTAETAG
ncbi:hypothetical protein ABZ345_36175 [Lentzea sp. NPDC005914]|uniref:hypothetical protein n=1 Tax=Lentzea sp. NPDC005914 TaxID=3154572 RepID=UPI0033D01FD7